MPLLQGLSFHPSPSSVGLRIAWCQRQEALPCSLVCRLALGWEGIREPAQGCGVTWLSAFTPREEDPGRWLCSRWPHAACGAPHVVPQERPPVSLCPVVALLLGVLVALGRSGCKLFLAVPVGVLLWGLPPCRVGAGPMGAAS